MIHVISCTVPGGNMLNSSAQIPLNFFISDFKLSSGKRSRQPIFPWDPFLSRFKHTISWQHGELCSVLPLRSLSRSKPWKYSFSSKSRSSLCKKSERIKFSALAVEICFLCRVSQLFVQHNAKTLNILESLRLQPLLFQTIWGGLALYSYLLVDPTGQRS